MKGERIAAEPSPQSGATDLSKEALGNNVLADFLDQEPGWAAHRWAPAPPPRSSDWPGLLHPPEKAAGCGRLGLCSKLRP